MLKLSTIVQTNKNMKKGSKRQIGNTMKECGLNGKLFYYPQHGIWEKVKKKAKRNNIPSSISFSSIWSAKTVGRDNHLSEQKSEVGDSVSKATHQRNELKEDMMMELREMLEELKKEIREIKMEFMMLKQEIQSLRSVTAAGSYLNQEPDSCCNDTVSDL
ncbi:hypothetical protein FDP41_005558 [Naegleria fowleri]|uniref:Uncharacterized protein n=1 Tax=Naegleria fowleri TaxID=5763 RepID=A0A6A5BNA8_NAEFO|nr:uncharacterized protein FDP41_005558 [Naegleria fowleri]KAF0975564.1 hypothetical protein FDP41_005558 [Naegleria fowleri]